jgi:hypothetical protein
MKRFRRALLRCDPNAENAILALIAAGMSLRRIATELSRGTPVHFSAGFLSEWLRETAESGQALPGG